MFGDEPGSETGTVDSLIPYPVSVNEGGFLRFRWPEKNSAGQWALRSPTRMPGYSLEQYSWAEPKYSEEVLTRLNLWSSPSDHYVSSGETLINALHNRVVLTERGYYLCSLVPCSSGESIYGDWSTPDRDRTLLSQIQSLQAVANVDTKDPNVQTFLQLAANPIFSGAPFTYGDVIAGDQTRAFSSDPTKGFLKRWGISAPMDSQTFLTVLANVAFDNYLWRLDLVSQAQDLCFPRGDGTAIACDPNDSQIRALVTDRLDRAFLRAQSEFINKFERASPEVQLNIEQLLKSLITSVPFCGSNACGNSYCSLYDLMVASPLHFRHMTSHPRDFYRSRVGF